MESGDLLADIKPKNLLSASNVSGLDLKKHLILVFGTYNRAAQQASFSESRLHQIFMGYDVPINPDTIKRIANAWSVDLVVLTQLFDKLRRGILE